MLIYLLPNDKSVIFPPLPDLPAQQSPSPSPARNTPYSWTVRGREQPNLGRLGESPWVVLRSLDPRSSTQVQQFVQIVLFFFSRISFLNILKRIFP